MKALRYIVLSLLVTCGVSLQAQDIHFSQFYMSPLNLNPALTGMNNCTSRFIANYRNQWAGILGANAYNTFSVSYDQKIPVGRTDYFGLGGTIWNDIAGATNFGTAQVRLSGSYSKKMLGGRKNSSYLAIGLDAALSRRSLGKEDLRWPTQFSKDGYDGSIDSGEKIEDFSFLYPDLALGLVWFSIIDENTNWYLGGALHHVNRPSVSFINKDYALNYRITAHGGGEFRLTPGMSLLPNFIFLKQGPHNEFNFGTSVRFRMGKYRTSNQAWQLGLWYRMGNKVDGGLHSDAAIISSRFIYEQFSIGLSYDYTVSDLQKAGTAIGSFEVSLKYEICGDEVRGVYCPHF